MHEKEIDSHDNEKIEPSPRQKPDKTSRIKLENYLEELALKRQLEDWGDEKDDNKE